MTHSLKKIHIYQLIVGMYIADLDCGWMAHPFLRSQFTVQSDKQIQTLRDHHIVEFYIDISKGKSCAEPLAPKEPAPTSDQQIQKILIETVIPTATHDFQTEYARAKTIISEANHIVKKIMADCRLGLKIDIDPLHDTVEQLSLSINRNPSALNILTRLKIKDDYTFHHSVSVGILLMIMEHSAGSKRDYILQVGIGGMLHDVGKSRIPSHILNKPDKLTPGEFEIMKRHVDYSMEVLNGCDYVSDIVKNIAWEHHERFDGTGYPHQKMGEQISAIGQKAAIIDVYDALTSDRSYHNGMQAPLAVRKIFEWSKYHFDPQLVKGFVKCFGIYPVGTLVSLASGKLAVISGHNQEDLSKPIVIAFFNIKLNRHIAPQTIDLAHTRVQGNDRIIKQEDPHHWQVNPERFL